MLVCRFALAIHWQIARYGAAGTLSSIMFGVLLQRRMTSIAHMHDAETPACTDASKLSDSLAEVG